ncbi:hypothetical protein [Massilia sp. GCM10023247]|uniref:hypothetical protein n=1 Tax=Massilia sp. GCM10023247 TaxID=3252643 RepID=UPI00361F60B5
MHSAIQPLIRTLVFYLLSVLAIALVLVVGGYVARSVQEYRVSSEDRQALAAVQAGIGQYRRGEADALVQRLGAAQALPLDAIERRIRGLTRTLQAAPPPGIELRALLRAGPGQYAGRLGAHYREVLARELAAQELAYLQQLRAQLVTLESRAGARRELERLHRVHSAVYRRYLQKQREADRLGYIDRQLMKHDWTITPALRRLAGELSALRMENQRAAAAWKAQKAALDRIGQPGKLRAFVPDEAALERAVQPLAELAAEVDQAVSAHPVSRIAGLLVPALPAAAAILLLCLAGKCAVRAFLYFVLAPLVTRRAPLRLDDAPRKAAAEACALIAPSGVTQALRLDPHHELLVLPRYLQSTPVAASKTTRWLLKGRWWTGLVSGIALLTCVRTSHAGEQVLLSAGDAGASELALVRVGAGSALVFQPRALVGLVCERDRPLAIEAHWRLASLHAWLTLQLRYFLIRGPVTLVLQGTRGVRVQQADGAHLVRQSATLGFSSDVAYSTLRSAPFLPYLQGQTELLYDRFAREGEGAGGIFIHDASPGTRGKGGRVKRGIEGLTDGVLKVFGF